MRCAVYLDGDTEPVASFDSPQVPDVGEEFYAMEFVKWQGNVTCFRVKRRMWYFQDPGRPYCSLYVAKSSGYERG